MTIGYASINTYILNHQLLSNTQKQVISIKFKPPKVTDGYV